ncbi:hypothetical protein [Luteibacter sp. CQ10]|uniref:hypothetical protein n=1 Tax=Luteibacter sp. CQ10 TaxID=2805821 RepID=UPI0034A42BC4
MNTMDFARYSPKQVQAHCANNLRSQRLDPNFAMYRRDALARCARLEADIATEVRAFHAWRISYIAPRREAWGHLGEAAEQATVRASQSVMRLRTTWGALAPLLSEPERTVWLQRTLGGE